jgi:prepilin-type N-terminal cleavage/methylation domain-containing protein
MGRRMGDRGSIQWAAPKGIVRIHRSRIINHPVIASKARQPLSFIHRRGFTLIELLVVISIIALLLAILFPALRAGRSHARTAACQGTLHQWGLYYAAYTSENDYKMPVYNRMKAAYMPDVLPRSVYWPHIRGKDPAEWDKQAWYVGMRGEYMRLLLCPEASRLKKLDIPPGFASVVDSVGGTHWPWVYDPSAEWPLKASYGFNCWTPGAAEGKVSGAEKGVWVSCLVKGASAVPVYFDEMWPFAWPEETDSPLSYPDGLPKYIPTYVMGMEAVAMDRHRGGTNSLFMDWSARKVGVKELWTLKWNPDYNTAGPWTKQGGVKREDWPEWMRRFRDY